MEQLLNIGWLFTIVGLVSVVAARRHRVLHPYGRYVVVVIFVCVALLLFPVISASDDLHPACVLGDDACWRHDKRSLGTQVVAVFLLISLAPLLFFTSGQLHCMPLAEGVAQPGHLRHDDGRAPPGRF